MKKILLIVGAAALAMIALSGLAWGAERALSKSQTETHPVAGVVRSVVVDVDTGDVSLARASSGVSVRQRAHWALKKPTVTRSLRDGVLTVKARCHGGFPFSDCDTDVRVALPDGVPVHVRTDVGDVTGALASRQVDVATNVGDVRLALAQAPDRVRAASNVGDVSLHVPRAAYAVDTDADVGDTAVHGLVQDERAARAIHAATDVGDVDVSAR